MNIKVNDICNYKGTTKTCLVLAILGDNAWVKATDLESEDNDYNGHVIPLEFLETPKQGGRVPVSTISVNATLYFNTHEAAQVYKDYIILENEMILFMKTAWENENATLDWDSISGKFSIIEKYGFVYNEYTVTEYHFITLPTQEDSLAFRELFSDEDIMKVLRRPQ